MDTLQQVWNAQEGSVSHGQNTLLREAEFLPYMREALSLTLSIGTPQNKQRNKNPKA